MKERRNFATGRPIAKRKRAVDHAAKVPMAKPKRFIEDVNDESESATFDPVRRDPFFHIVEASHYWPPSAEVVARLQQDHAASGSGMAMYGGRDGNKTSSVKRVKPASKGLIKHPRNVDVSHRRKVLDSDSGSGDDDQE